MEERFHQLLSFYHPASAIRVLYDELELILDIYKIDTTQTLLQLIHILNHASHMLPQDSIVRQRLSFIKLTFTDVTIPEHLKKNGPWFMDWTIAMFKQHVSEILRELTYYEPIFANTYVSMLPSGFSDLITRRNEAIYNHFSKKSLHVV